MISQLHYRLGTLYYILDNTSDAITHYNQYIALLGSDLSRDETYLLSMRSLAQLYSKDGDWEKSLSIYNELIHFMEITGTDQNVLAAIYHETGRIHFKLNNHDEALNSLKTSTEMRKSMMNDANSHNQIGQVLLDLSKVYEVMGDCVAASNSLLEVRCCRCCCCCCYFFRAEKPDTSFFSKALFIFKLKRNDTDRITTLMELARLYEKMEKMDEARECYEDCIAIEKSLPRVSDQSKARTMYSFASLLMRMSEEERALGLFQIALKIQEKSRGTDDHVMTLRKISEIQIHTLLYDNALANLEQVLQFWSKSGNNRLKETADCNRDVGLIYSEREDYEKAIPYLNEAADLYDTIGVDDEMKSSSLHLLGRALCMTCKYTLAKENILQGKRDPAPVAV